MNLYTVTIRRTNGNLNETYYIAANSAKMAIAKAYRRFDILLKHNLVNDKTMLCTGLELLTEDFDAAR